MPGLKPKLDHVRKDFNKEVNSATSLLAAIRAIPKSVRQVAGQLHPKHERLIVELAFLGLFASWEEFLERSFVRYVAGAGTASGYLPTPKYGLAKDVRHAYQLITKDPQYDPGVKYFKSSDPKWYCIEADFYFSLHPYGCLKVQKQVLQYALAIRNRIAHSSEKCRNDFKTAALQMLQPASGKLSQGYGPGDLLRETAKRHFGSSVRNRGISYFEAYLELMKDLAAKIVP